MHDAGLVGDVDETFRLERERSVSLRGDLNDDLATEVIAKLLYLESTDPRQPVTLTIDSSGGSVIAGLAVIEAVQSLRNEVRTQCRAKASGISALVLAAGRTGSRSAHPACVIALVEPMFEAPTAGSTSEGERQQARLRNEVERLFVKLSGQPLARVRIQLKSGAVMTATEAQAFGLVDTLHD